MTIHPTDILPVRSDVVFFEGPHKYSLKKLTVPDGVTVKFGQVLGRITADGTHVPLAPAAGDGSELAEAVAMTEKSVAEGEGHVFGIVRHAIVNDAGLVWPEAIDEAQKALAVEQLEDKGVLVQ